MLFFAESLSLAIQAEDADLEKVIRSNLAGWRQKLHRLRAASNVRTPVRGLAFTREGKAIAAGGEETGSIKILSKEDDAIEWPDFGPIKPVRALASNPDRTILVTGHADGNAFLWDATTGRPLAKLADVNTGDVTAVAFSPDGRTVMTGRAGGTADLWQLPGNEPITVAALEKNPQWDSRRLLHPARHIVKAVAFHPNGRFAITGSEVIPRLDLGNRSGAVIWWDLKSDKPSFEQVFDRPITAIAVHPNPKNDICAITTASEVMGTAELWRFDNKTAVPVANLPHLAGVFTVAFSPDGRFVATGSQDRTARLWNVMTGEPIGQPLRHHLDVRAIAFDPESQTIVTASDDRVCRFWDITTVEPTHKFKPLGPISTALISTDGRRSYFGGISSDFIDVATEEKIPNESEPRLPVWASAYSALAGSYVTAGGFPGNPGFICLWDEQCKLRGTPIELTSQVLSVTISPNGEYLAAGCADGTAHVWDIRVPNKPARILSSANGGQKVYALAFSADGRYLLTGGLDMFARIWDVLKPKAEPEYKSKLPNVILSAAFSTDSHTLVIGYSGAVQLYQWDGRSKPEELRSLEHQAGIMVVAVSPDGKVLTGGTNDGKSADGKNPVRLWDSRTAKQLGPPWPHLGFVRAVGFAPESSIFTASTTVARGEAFCWNLPNPVDGDPTMIRAWAEVITGAKKEGDVLVVMEKDDWRARALQHPQVPNIETTMAERRAKSENRPKSDDATTTKPVMPAPGLKPNNPTGTGKGLEGFWKWFGLR